MESKEALYYKGWKHKVQCRLCPHQCRISEGKTGKCRVRSNRKGRLYADSYGQVVARHLDPIEKKPLYHYFPGKQVYSVGTAGCNMACFFCQNCGISQRGANAFPDAEFLSPESLVRMALERDSIGIAYTYNEPTVWTEYLLDVMPSVHQAGLKNIMVSNGFIMPAPLTDLLEHADAFNIDLKAFNNSFYQRYTNSSLQAVLDSLLQIKEAGKWLEISFLLIPNLNSDREKFGEMLHWIETQLGDKQVLHISRYFPAYKSTLQPTPESMVLEFAEIASRYLSYVYTGNIHNSSFSDTHCPVCHQRVVRRNGYSIESYLDIDGRCTHCQYQILKPESHGKLD